MPEFLVEPSEAHVNGDHRKTLQRIFSHPTSANIEWRQVLSLLEAVGEVRRRDDGKFEVSVDDEQAVLERPHGKDVDRQMIVDLRRLLHIWDARLHGT